MLRSGVEEERTIEAPEEPRLFGRVAWYRRRVESLEELAVVDDLTGLRNQRALWRELGRRVRVCSSSSPLAVVMVDFDLFKEVNEGYGHAVGDAVLRRGASVLRAAAPSPRLAFRYGGEEFVLLMQGGEAEGRALAEQVRAEVARQNGALPAVTISCGVAALEAPVEPWVALDHADAALREAKRAGRNRVVAASQLGRGGTNGAYLVEELEHETARRAALALAVATLEVRDPDTAGHCDDVLTLCEAMGRQLGFDERALKLLTSGAQLHDVGKVAVPSAILNKPGRLDESEWDVIREHTVIGERILRSVPEMAEVATIVRHSHEHWDGSGYPDGLRGEQIPLASRVILCADAFHAIRSDRPYRAGRAAPDALAEVQAAAGTQFDPAVVDALVATAADVKQRRIGVALPRNKRLIALLATMIIGGGSAVAGVPELRDALRSVFGSGTAQPRVLPGAPLERFDLGPVGDLLTFPPAAAEGKRRTPDAGRKAPRTKAHGTGRSDRRRAAGDAAPGGPRGTGGGRLTPAGDGSPKRRPPRAPEARAPQANPPSGDVNPLTPAAPAPAPQQQQPATQEATGNGNGNAVGRDVPTPRTPVESPRHPSPGSGRPESPGRDDPPALGKRIGPAS